MVDRQPYNEGIRMVPPDPINLSPPKSGITRDYVFSGEMQNQLYSTSNETVLENNNKQTNLNPTKPLGLTSREER